MYMLLNRVCQQDLNCWLFPMGLCIPLVKPAAIIPGTSSISFALYRTVFVASRGGCSGLTTFSIPFSSRGPFSSKGRALNGFQPFFCAKVSSAHFRPLHHMKQKMPPVNCWDTVVECFGDVCSKRGGVPPRQLMQTSVFGQKCGPLKASKWTIDVDQILHNVAYRESFALVPFRWKGKIPVFS